LNAYEGRCEVKSKRLIAWLPLMKERLTIVSAGVAPRCLQEALMQEDPEADLRRQQIISMYDTSVNALKIINTITTSTKVMRGAK